MRRHCAQSSFAQLGLNDVTELYVEDRNESNDRAKLEALEGVQAVFFSGGDQLRIMSQIGGTPIFDPVLEIYKSGDVEH
ncbi:type 1 glutamine amidotransferase family protein [Devosia aurantiaca]|uniref:Uncharacterized protein n=1 Tax=Devosia aurantiaca TaxID=2714858 RepID=A0A6M1S910_9HYPH|nr:hypothetical protein [Devosia aurantiaca]NGP16499.1 hypothetical protein [Devosia aurantiaca]